MFIQNDDQPAVCVNYNDAKSYVAWLSEKSEASYDLPRQNELEYAAQADSSTKVFWTNNESACEYANINDMQGHTVNKFDWKHAQCNDGYPQSSPSGLIQSAGKNANIKPNKFGIYHLIGNVYEWLSTDEGCGTAGQTWIWGGSWTSAPDKSVAAPGWCQSKEFRAIDIGIRVVIRNP